MKSVKTKPKPVTRTATLWCVSLVIATLVSLAGGMSPTAQADSGRQWPVTGSVIRRFQKPAEDWLPGHRGIDIAAPAGTTVVAAAAGVVTWAGVIAGVPSISITHSDGLKTTYQPVIAEVSIGQQVTTGAVIGILQAGHATTDCLHFGLLRGTTYLDPLLWLVAATPGPIRLLPTDTHIPLISKRLLQYLADAAFSAE